MIPELRWSVPASLGSLSGRQVGGIYVENNFMSGDVIFNMCAI